MVFDSSKGQTEARESEKLVYHWTKDAPDNKVNLAEQIDDVCLCDASINVSRLFPIENEDNASTTTTTTTNVKQDENKRTLKLKFENTIVLIVEVEPDQSIWMAAHIAPPCNDQGYQQQHTSIPTDALERFINNIYIRFCLLNGTFRMIGKQAKSVCEDYFNIVLRDVHLDSSIANIASLYNYILYQDLNAMTLMKTNSFINHLVSIDPDKIRHTIVIFNDQLVWSSLTMHTTRFLYNYMVSVLVRDALQEELSTEVDKVRRIKENLPIYIAEEGNNLDDCRSKFYMTVFRSSNNMTLGMIFSEPDQNELIQKCERMLTSDSRLGVIPLVSLAQSVGQNFLKSNSMGANVSSHVFINKLSLSISRPQKTDTQVREHLTEIEPELRALSKERGSLAEEFYARTLDDSWLTVTNTKYRTTYSVNNVINSGLTEAHQSASTLKSTFALSRP